MHPPATPSTDLPRIAFRSCTGVIRLSRRSVSTANDSVSRTSGTSRLCRPAPSRFARPSRRGLHPERESHDESTCSPAAPESKISRAGIVSHSRASK